MATRARGLLFWLLFILLLLAPLLVSLRVHEPFSVPKVLFLQTMAALLLMYWATKSLVARKVSLPTHPFFISMYAIFTWQLITFSWALYSPAASKELYQAFALLIVSISAYFLPSRSLMKKVLVGAVCAGVITSSLALLQYYKLDGFVLDRLKIDGFFDLSYLVNPIRPGSRPFLHGFDGNRNHLAGYIIGLVPILVIYLTKGSNEGFDYIRFFSIISSLLFVSVLLLSYCRGAWLSLLVAMLFYFFLCRRMRVFIGLALSMLALVFALGLPELHPSWALFLLTAGLGVPFLTFFPLGNKRRLLVVCLMGVAALVGLWIPGRNPLSMAHYSLFQRIEKLTKINDSGPLARRLETHVSWSMATASLKTIIFGRGVGQYGVHYQTIQGALLEKEEFASFLPKAGYTSRAHNEFFQRWCQEGLVGLLLALWAIIVFFRSLCQKEHVQDDWLLLAMIFSILALNIHSLFSFAIHKPPVAILNALLLGFSMRLFEENEAKWPLTKRLDKVIFVLPMVIMALILANVTFSSVMAEHKWYRAIELERAGKIAKSLVELRKATLWASDEHELLYAYGVSLLKVKQWQGALRCFERAEKARVIPEAAFNRAICHLHLVQPEEAEKQLRRTLYYNPSHFRAAVGLCEMLIGRQQLDEALSITKRALSADPYSVDLLQLQSRLYGKKGDFDSARLAISTAIWSTPEEPTTDILLSALILNLKCFEQADTLKIYKMLRARIGEAELRKKLPTSALLMIDYFRVIDNGSPETIRAFSQSIVNRVEDRANEDMRRDASNTLKEHLDKHPNDEIVRRAYEILLGLSKGAK